jgi:hypothetical protein
MPTVAQNAHIDVPQHAKELLVGETGVQREHGVKWNFSSSHKGNEENSLTFGSDDTYRLLLNALSRKTFLEDGIPAEVAKFATYVTQVSRRT